MLKRIPKKIVYFVVLLALSLILAIYTLALVTSLSPRPQILETLKPTELQPVVQGKTNSKPVLHVDNTGYFKVVHVVDGDTLDIERAGLKVRLRLLGINSPESVAPNRPEECFGPQASAYMKSLVAGKFLKLEYDPAKPVRDKYDRELVYAYLNDGQSVNLIMITKGYAYEYTYQGEKYTYQAEYKLAEMMAKKAGAGLWAQDTCEGLK